MQIVGLAILAFVVWFGFGERDSTVISAFDFHAFVMVMGGSFSAILIMSTGATTGRTFLLLREIIPGLGRLARVTQAQEAERKEFTRLWVEGKRAQAVELAERSAFPSIGRMLRLVLGRAPSEASRAAFTELNHDELSHWQPAIGNWEMLARLAPSFGMVGTITGMIQVFKSMGDDSMNLGSAISLALLATLYGVAFGAGVAGPIGHYLRGLLDERLGVLERCRYSVDELVARSSRDAAAPGGQA